ncbi:FCD domain-containing protein [Cohnella lubricantis]|uniref:FadR/GntR family transcriptional regulator n=1 Tax=Cohnella lubricantis TaxID=2163172 RepID=UPI002893437F|nr:FCD domain-containing protein [Cohnella lubricantis]MBP2119627.1 GntR family transcriptional repressor for pyruvate dehydrogenase complex [Cohnella lubricantis]
MPSLRIETQKSHEIVARDMRRRIEAGEWTPGAKLPSVVDLAASYGVGRSTIREAVSALKAMGWLDVRHGGGTFVRQELPQENAPLAADAWLQGAESVLEILEVRQVLERGTAALAARRRSEEQLQQLRQALLRMELGLEADDSAESERADVSFHAAIAAAAGNSLLLSLMDSLSQRMTETIQRTRELWFYEEKASAEQLLIEHKGIYQAIEDGDPEQAEARMEAHLAKVEKVLNEALADTRNDD